MNGRMPSITRRTALAVLGASAAAPALAAKLNIIPEAATRDGVTLTTTTPGSPSGKIDTASLRCRRRRKAM